MSFVPSFPILGSSGILASCVQVPGSEEIPTFPLPLMCQSELITPIRCSCIDTELIHRMNCLKQEFRVHRVSIEVKSIFLPFFCFKIPRFQCTGTFEHKMTTFLESLYLFFGLCDPTVLVDRENRLTISLPTPGHRNVPCPGKIFSRNS